MTTFYVMSHYTASGTYSPGYALKFVAVPASHFYAQPGNSVAVQAATPEEAVAQAAAQHRQGLH